MTDMSLKSEKQLGPDTFESLALAVQRAEARYGDELKELQLENERLRSHAARLSAQVMTTKAAAVPSPPKRRKVESSCENGHLWRIHVDGNQIAAFYAFGTAAAFQMLSAVCDALGADFEDS